MPDYSLFEFDAYVTPASQQIVNINSELETFCYIERTKDCDTAITKSLQIEVVI